MKLTDVGSPINPKYKITGINIRQQPTKVSEHPVWRYEKKPWTQYSHKGLESSIEMHYLYKVPSICGSGNYANLGTFRGASAAALAFGLKENDIQGKIYAVDIYHSEHRMNPERLKEEFKKLELDSYLEVCKGFTHEWAEKLKNIEFTFIFIDADHCYETCKQDYELWSPLLKKDGLLCFHDSNLNTVAKVISELPEEWVLIDHIDRIKTFRKQ